VSGRRLRRPLIFQNGPIESPSGPTTPRRKVTEIHKGSKFKGLAMGNFRRRVKHTLTFDERLADEAKRFREAAERELPGSKARELLLRRAQQTETAAHMRDWLRSPGLQSAR
jgi:hypothetical protein